MEPLDTQLRNTHTLKEWCDALGQPVPGLEARAALYETYRLGPISTYTGTAEQNNRLLVELKRQRGLF